MSLILDTYDANTWISHISEDARKHLVIICPFLNINEKLRRAIKIADSKGVKLFVIYGKKKLDEETEIWLKGLNNSNIACIKDLHAKLYMNENFAVISSMNLYEYSQVNNEELGVLFGKKQDRTEFKDITFQVMRLIEISEKEYGKWDIGDLDKPIRGLFKRNKQNDTYESKKETLYEDETLEVPDNSQMNFDSDAPRTLCHCIRCNRIIPSDHEFLYCGRCMESWQRYSNMKYVELDGHCYICGKPYSASAEKPACLECYRSHSELIRTKCESMRKVSNSKNSHQI